MINKEKKIKVDFKEIEELVNSLDFKFALIEGTTTTVCKAVLPNGFTVGTGESACVDISEYNQELGEKYAKERAIQDATNELWKLEGYLLKITGATTADHVKFKEQFSTLTNNIKSGVDVKDLLNSVNESFRNKE